MVFYVDFVHEVGPSEELDVSKGGFLTGILFWVFPSFCEPDTDQAYRKK